MLVIVNDSCGQMCNKIYNQVNVIATGLDNDIPISYYEFNEYSSFKYSNEKVDGILKKKKKSVLKKIFFRLMSMINMKLLKNTKRFISIEDQYTCSKSILNLSKEKLTQKNYYVEGWPFVNLPAVRNQIEEIRKYYSKSEEMCKYLDDKLKNYNKLKTNLIGVHIRRGDYKNWRGGAYYYPDEVYISKIEELNRCLVNKKNVFFIFSNEWLCEEKYRSDKYDVVFPHGNGEEDFHLLTKMDYIIGPPSSFSGIASLIGGVPRFIIQNADDMLSLEEMKVWLAETDNDGNSISF